MWCDDGPVVGLQRLEVPITRWGCRLTSRYRSCNPTLVEPQTSGCGPISLNARVNAGYHGKASLLTIAVRVSRSGAVCSWCWRLCGWPQAKSRTQTTKSLRASSTTRVDWKFHCHRDDLVTAAHRRSARDPDRRCWPVRFVELLPMSTRSPRSRAASLPSRSKASNQHQPHHHAERDDAVG